MWLFSVISEQIVFWLLKVNNANTRATCEICSKLTIDIRTTSSTFLVETCEVISEVQRKKNSKKKKHSVVTNSSKSSILLQSCCLWKRNCKLMKIENGFLPLSLPISFLKCSDYMILCTKKNFRAVCYASTIDNNVFR